MRRDAVQNRQLLLDAATEVFATSGLEGTVEDVARTAGVGLGTLYRHFATKDDLINELVRELLADVLVGADAAVAEPDGYGFERFLYAIGELQSSRRGCLGRLERTSTPAIKKLVWAIEGTTATLLADAKAHGRIRPETTLTDVRAITYSLRGIIEIAGDIAPGMWRRHLEVILVGLQPSPTPLRNRPVPKSAIDRLPPAAPPRR